MFVFVGKKIYNFEKCQQGKLAILPLLSISFHFYFDKNEKRSFHLFKTKQNKNLMI